MPVSMGIDTYGKFENNEDFNIFLLDDKLSLSALIIAYRLPM